MLGSCLGNIIVIKFFIFISSHVLVALLLVLTSGIKSKSQKPSEMKEEANDAVEMNKTIKM